MFKFLLIFLIDIITPLFHLLRLHVTSCVYSMWFINFYIVHRKKAYFFSIKSFSVGHALVRAVFHI